MLAVLRWVLVLFVWVWLTPAWAAVATLNEIRLSAGAESKSRLVLQLSESPSYQVFSLSHPDRLVLDVREAQWNGVQPDVPSDHPQLQAIRIAQHENRVRMVMDLKRHVDANVFVLPPSAQSMHRLVLDLVSGDQGQLSTASAANGSVMQPTAVNTLSARKRDVVVVIDPGHGGKDPGASGLWGTREKDVVLGIAKALYQELNAKPGFKAVLTRHQDVYIPLRQRLAIARTHQADIFISIHADAFKLRSAAGASIYALSMRGASSEAAKWLADSENTAALMGGVALDDKGSMLRGVLLDLSQNATIEASLSLGKNLLSQIEEISKLHRSNVDQAAFVVLKSPDIPSVLVETGFMSNPKEEERLRSAKHQRAFGRALATGIEVYFKSHAPKDSYLAWHARQPAQRYHVKAGDTLSEIARRFGCSLSVMSESNQGLGDRLKVGQVLVVPKCRS